nr:trihelix transcription factor ASIL2-like [Tanacetum cinerariifolium]
MVVCSVDSMNMMVLPCLVGVDLRSATRQQKLKLENVRLNFQRELELHMKVVLERVHAKLAIIREKDDEDANSVDNESLLAATMHICLNEVKLTFVCFAREVALSECRTDEGDTNDIPTALREVEEEIRVDGPPSLQSSFWICLRMLKAMPRYVIGSQVLCSYANGPSFSYRRVIKYEFLKPLLGMENSLKA